MCIPAVSAVICVPLLLFFAVLCVPLRLRAFVHWCAQSVRYQKWITLAMILASLLSVYVYLFVMEKDFLGTTEQNEFIIFVELPAGAKLDISDQVVRQVEALSLIHI